MRFVDDCVHNEDQHYQYQKDWLDLQKGRVHVIPTIPKTRQARRIAPNKELSATHEVTGHSVIPIKDVVPVYPQSAECL